MIAAAAVLAVAVYVVSGKTDPALLRKKFLRE
jgi:hypothetical protein